MSSWSFEFPWLLTGFISAIIPVWCYFRGPPSLRFSSLQILNKSRFPVRDYPGYILLLLKVLSILLLVLAAANPRRPDLRTRLPVEGISIMLVLDVSGSMATEDFPALKEEKMIRRLDAAREAFRLFVLGGEMNNQKFPGRPADRIGVVTFAAVPEAVSPLTFNHESLFALIKNIEPKTGLDAGSNVGDGLGEGILRLHQQATGRKIILLLSDGEHNVGVDRPEPPLTPRQAAQLAEKLQIPIYAMDVGGDVQKLPEVDKQARQAGKKILDDVARMTGGKMFSIADEATLLAVFSEIDQSERQEVLSYRYRRYHEYGFLFGLIALGVLLLLFFLEHTRWQTIP